MSDTESGKPPVLSRRSKMMAPARFNDAMALLISDPHTEVSGK
jgi:hypothetical protein